MSFSDTLSLDDTSGDLVAYSTVRSTDPARKRRLDTSSPLAEPRTMDIAHSTIGQGAGTSDRHLIAFGQTKVNAAGVPVRATVNFTVTIPRDTAITTEMVTDLVSNLVDFISGGGFGDSGMSSTANLLALFRGEE